MKNGFTLSEVLIALGIIGVVAAITMPVLIKNYNKKVIENKLKLGYTTYVNAIKLSEIDNGSISEWDSSIQGEEYWTKYMAPYFKGAKLCKNPKDCGYKNLNSKDFTGLNYGVITSGDRILFALPNNIVIFRVFESSNTHFYMDVNGAKGPNKLGQDVLMFKTVNNPKIITPWSSNAIKILQNNY